MKKTIFTFCSVAVVCCAIFFACAKDDNSITHVTYVSQSSGTGGNPNPNGVPSNSGYGTTTTTGTTTGSTTSTTSTPTNTTSTNFTYDGTAASSPTANGVASGSTFVVSCFDSNGTPSIQLTFPGTTAPASGNYAIVIASPTGNQCNFLYTSATGNSSAVAGTVVVTAGTPNTAAFTSVSCSGAGGSHTVSGAIKY